MIVMMAGFFFACQSEIDNKQAAEVKEPIETNKPAVVSPKEKSANPGKVEGQKGWSLAPTSKVEWVGAKVTGDHTGGFKKITGTANVEGGKLKQLTAEIDIASLFSDNRKLTAHLLNKDFFEVDKFAKASFRSTEISEKNIKGILDMHGVKKEISFAAEISVSASSVSIKGDFTINRKLWGINYKGQANNLIKDEVLIKLNVQYKS